MKAESSNPLIVPDLKDKKILIVEDDDLFREAMSGYLARKGMSVSVAANGRIAKDLCSVMKFDLIVSDIQMPHMNGIELLKWVKANQHVPFILTTGFTNLLETQTAFELGADEFVVKPFRNADLLEAISSVLVPTAQEKPQAVNMDEFSKVSIEHFINREETNVDVYVRLSQVKMIKIGSPGDQIPHDQILEYRKNGLKYLYVKSDDFLKLVPLREKRIFLGQEAVDLLLEDFFATQKRSA